MSGNWTKFAYGEFRRNFPVCLSRYDPTNSTPARSWLKRVCWVEWNSSLTCGRLADTLWFTAPAWGAGLCFRDLGCFVGAYGSFGSFVIEKLKKGPWLFRVYTGVYNCLYYPVIWRLCKKNHYDKQTKQDHIKIQLRWLMQALTIRIPRKQTRMTQNHRGFDVMFNFPGQGGPPGMGSHSLAMNPFAMPPGMRLGFVKKLTGFVDGSFPFLFLW